VDPLLTYAHDAIIPALAEGKAKEVTPPLRRWNAVTLDPVAVRTRRSGRTLLTAIRVKLAEPARSRRRASTIYPMPPTRSSPGAMTTGAHS
jgi:hypothetical protein